MADPQQQRPPMAVALEWVSRITTVALEMVLPGLLGLWIDGKLGVKLVFTLLGFGLGGSLAMWHLLRMTRVVPNGRDAPSRRPGASDKRLGDKHSSEDGK